MYRAVITHPVQLTLAANSLPVLIFMCRWHHRYRHMPSSETLRAFWSLFPGRPFELETEYVSITFFPPANPSLN
jgi:hypothetical protein